jgi:predicted transcriptional regulator
LTPVKKNVLDQLIAKGFVTASDQASSAKYKLTGKAQQLLAERGVGLSGG